MPESEPDPPASDEPESDPEPFEPEPPDPPEPESFDPVWVAFTGLAWGLFGALSDIMRLASQYACPDKWMSAYGTRPLVPLWRNM